MAWIYFQESGVLAKPSNHGLKPLPIVRMTDTHNLFYCPECQMANFSELRYGMTCVHCEAQCSRYPLISSPQAFHAKILALQALVKAWKESEVDFFTKLSGLQMKYVRRLCFWKMSQQLELADFELWSENLPNFGMMCAGRVYLPQNLEPRTTGNAGSYLPTPTASDYGTGGNGVRKGKQKQIISLGTMARKNLWPTPLTSDWKKRGKKSEENRNSPGLPHQVGGPLNPNFVEWLVGFPTGWTELKDWVIPWYQHVRKKHLRYYLDYEV